MTGHVSSLRLQDTLQRVRELMDEKTIRHVRIVDAEGNLVGVGVAARSAPLHPGARGRSPHSPPKTI